MGQLTTNPPPLAARIDDAKKTLAPLEAAAKDASSKLAALQKALADRKTPADTAQKAATEAAAAVEPLTQAKAVAEAGLAEKSKLLQTAEANFQSAEGARTKAAAERDAVAHCHRWLVVRERCCRAGASHNAGCCSLHPTSRLYAAASCSCNNTRDNRV